MSRQAPSVTTTHLFLPRSSSVGQVSTFFAPQSFLLGLSSLWSNRFSAFRVTSDRAAHEYQSRERYFHARSFIAMRFNMYQHLTCLQIAYCVFECLVNIRWCQEDAFISDTPWVRHYDPAGETDFRWNVLPTPTKLPTTVFYAQWVIIRLRPTLIFRSHVGLP